MTMYEHFKQDHGAEAAVFRSVSYGAIRKLLLDTDETNETENSNLLKLRAELAPAFTGELRCLRAIRHGVIADTAKMLSQTSKATINIAQQQLFISEFLGPHITTLGAHRAGLGMGRFPTMKHCLFL